MRRSDVTVLLRAEHAVARVLASAPDEATAYPALLAAIGESLGWDVGAVWEPGEDGVARYAATGQGRMIDHPVEIEAMRKDGSEFPVELAITRPELAGPPLFCGYIRDITERRAAEAALRRLVEEQAALRRVATAVAAETDPNDVFGLVTEEVGRLLGAEIANMVRYDGGNR